MFTNKVKSTAEIPVNPSSGRTGIIGTGMVIVGDVTTESDVRVDGKLIGNIHSSARVVIGTEGCIEGNIYAVNADVSGQVEGNIVIKELLNVRSKAQIHGDLEAGKLSMEPNAVFNGNCKTGLNIAALQVVEMNNETNERRLAAAQ